MPIRPNLLLLLLLVLLLGPEINARRKWDKVDAEISIFFPGAHYVMLTFNDDALSGADTYGISGIGQGEQSSGVSLMSKTLDILAKYKARATFFVQGVNAAKYPDVIARMRRERHEIANLGWETTFVADKAVPAPHATTVSADGSPADEELLHQIKQTSEAVERATGHPTTVYRPPYGQVRNSQRGGFAVSHYQSKFAEMVHGNAAHQVVLWSLDAPGYGNAKSQAGSTAKTSVNAAGEGEGATVRESILSHVKKGDVVLLHITPATVAALESVVQRLQAKGFESLTLTEMLSFPDDKPH
jgi:peptidoglycan/xylan/chitin deacetylase (PgdA/CDA1 family)